jgi:hypothetical protein
MSRLQPVAVMEEIWSSAPNGSNIKQSDKLSSNVQVVSEWCDATAYSDLTEPNLNETGKNDIPLKTLRSIFFSNL